MGIDLCKISDYMAESERIVPCFSAYNKDLVSKKYYFCSQIPCNHIAMTVTDIYEVINGNADRFFECAQANPKFGLLFASMLLAVWFTGLLLRWKWARHWQFGGKLWFFDDCKPETRRRVQIALVSAALIGCLTMFFVI